MNAEQAGQVAKQYTGNIRNVRTPEGSFIEFEPTGTIKTPKISRSGLKGLTTKTPELIGDTGNIKVSTKLKSPVRLEARENLQPASIRASNIPDRLQLPEITYDLETTAKAVKDPLTLKSGRASFWESEAGELLTKEKRKTVINDVPWMKEQVVRTKAEILVKEPFKSPIDFNPEFERLYNNAGKTPKVPRETIEVSQSKTKTLPRTINPGFMLGFVSLPSTSPDLKRSPTQAPIFNVSPFPIVTALPSQGITPRRTQKPSTRPRTSPIFSPGISSPITETLNIKTFPGLGVGLPRMTTPLTIEHTPRKKSQRKGKKKGNTSWRYDRLYNNFRDIAETMNYRIPRMRF